MLERPDNLVIEQVLKFEFIASNNQTEYEALIVCMILTLKMGATRLKAKSKSQLVVNQVSGQYRARESQLIKYLHKDFGVHASADEYEKLIQSLCLKALDWERAEKLPEEMERKKKGLYLKGITRALVRAVKETE